MHLFLGWGSEERGGGVMRGWGDVGWAGARNMIVGWPESGFGLAILLNTQLQPQSFSGVHNASTQANLGARLTFASQNAPAPVDFESFLHSNSPP